MVKEKEQICINAVSKILCDNYGSPCFSVNGPKEWAACMEESVGGGMVYCVERGNEFDVKRHSHVVDACVDLITRLGVNDDLNGLIDQFYSSIIGEHAVPGDGMSMLDSTKELRFPDPKTQK